MSAITAKASRKMKKYAVLTREPRCFLGSFDFSWEQRKLGELLQTLPFKQFLKEPEPDGKYEIIQQGNEPVIGFANGTPCGDYKDVVIFGDHTLSLYKPQHPFFVATDGVRIVKGQQDTDGYYLLSLLERYKPQSEGYKRYYSILADTNCITTYNTSEQEKIGVFFKLLGNLITLHQRKCALLFSPFQALISMMFTTSTFSWEQRKLGELALFNPKDELPQTFEYVDLESVVGTEMLSHRTEVKSSAPSRAQRLAHTGDLFYQTVRPYQKNNYLFEKPDNNYVFSTGYAQMRPYVDGYFLLSLLQSERFVKVVLDNCTGTSYPAINANDLAEIEVAAPSDESEAQRIGTIFRSIDNLITLHQRKCISFTGRAGRLISTVNKKRITSSWEQRKFSDITFPAGEKNRDNLPLESYSITNEHGFVPQDEKFENGGTMREADKRMYYIVSPNSFAYNPARINVGSIGYQNIGKNVIVSSLYEVFKTSEDVDDRLLWHWLKSPDFQKLIMQLQEGGVRLYFYYDKLCMGEVSLPSLEEQRKIGKLFDTLDNLITLHQRKPFLMKWRNSDANRNQTNRLVL